MTNSRKLNSRIECYALLTRLSAEAMQRGDRRTANGYARSLGVAPFELDTFIPASLTEAFVRFNYLEHYGQAVHYRCAPARGVELN